MLQFLYVMALSQVTPLGLTFALQQAALKRAAISGFRAFAFALIFVCLGAIVRVRTIVFIGARGRIAGIATFAGVGGLFVPISFTLARVFT